MDKEAEGDFSAMYFFPLKHSESYKEWISRRQHFHLKHYLFFLEAQS